MKEIQGLAPRFFVRPDGSFLGSYSPVDGDAVGPFFEAGEIEVAEAPEHASQTWDGAAWSPAPVPEPAPLTADELATLLRLKGTITQGDIDAEIGKRP